MNAKVKNVPLEKEIYKNAMNHLDYISHPRWGEKIEYLKSKVRSKVEHNLYIIKHLFGYRKVRYSGIEKNGAGLYMIFAKANLLRWSWRLKSLGSIPVNA